MEPDFWRERWAENKIGFHEGAPNTMLVSHLYRLAGHRVLVPLCGKTEDLAYLAAQGKRVIGVELVEDAVAQFFAEHEVTPTITTHDGLREYTAGEITIFAGDWFAVTAAHTGPIEGFYDRAALIALPAEMRVRYLEHLRSVVPENTRGLLITVDYDAAQFQAPPHPVPDSEVQAHYAAAELLEETPNSTGRLGEANIGAVDRCYAVRL